MQYCFSKHIPNNKDMIHPKDGQFPMDMSKILKLKKKMLGFLPLQTVIAAALQRNERKHLINPTCIRVFIVKALLYLFTGRLLVIIFK